MNIEQYKQFLLSNIKPWAKPASGGRLVNCRCFYCRDSDDPTHGHFYISIPTEKDPSMYYCQKCKTSGIVTPIKLMDWGIYDSNIAIDLAKLNKSTHSRYNSKYYTSKLSYIRNTRISISDITNRKIEYIENRLGCRLTYQDCIDLKIVPNICDILSENKLTATRDPRIIQSLNSDFIGFLSRDNSCLNMRNIYMNKNIHPSLNKRYINYNLIDIENNITRRFYSVPTIVNLNSLEPIKMHIAEGPFDILSILINLRETTKQNVYISIGGCGYEKIAEYFIYMLKTPNLEIHVYPDNDVSNDTMINMANKMSVFKYPFYIHRNIYKGEKDFGVPKNRIQEIIEEYAYNWRS